MSEDTKKFLTSDYVPVAEGELVWVFIDAPGKPAMDPTKPNRKQATLRVESDSEGCKNLIAAIKEFWAANKVKGQKLKSLGYTEEKKVKEGLDKNDDDFDSDDDSNFDKTGYTLFQFWTGANWPDGKDRVVDIYNAKGNKVSLGDKKIANGSFGAISGTMKPYHSGKNHGVSLFLNAIQLVKFVEYTQDAGFESQEEEVEGGFEGVDADFENTTTSDAAEPNTTTAKPKL